MTITAATLNAHTDEVWDTQWSHDGAFLASASKDKSAIIWRKASSPSASTSMKDWSVHLVLRDHKYAVGCLAWSPDDKVLLTSSENLIKMWDVKTGRCIRTFEEHQDTVTSICWLRDGTGFVTGSLDRKIVTWNQDGQVKDVWERGPIRITDLKITPDAIRLVAIGLEYIRQPETPAETGESAVMLSPKYWLIVYDIKTKEIELSARLETHPTSIHISPDSQFALINQAPNEIHLWDLSAKQIQHRYKGQKQWLHVIRSCFGGVDGSLVISGSEDGNVYVWDRYNEELLEVLSGHGSGSVNTVASNPVNNHLLVSCSDDHTIRIWEVPPSSVEQKVDPQVV